MGNKERTGQSSIYQGGLTHPLELRDAAGEGFVRVLIGAVSLCEDCSYLHRWENKKKGLAVQKWKQEIPSFLVRDTGGSLGRGKKKNVSDAAGDELVTVLYVLKGLCTSFRVFLTQGSLGQGEVEGMIYGVPYPPGSTPSGWTRGGR